MTLGAIGMEDVQTLTCFCIPEAAGRVFLQYLHEFTGAAIAALSSPIGTADNPYHWEIVTQVARAIALSQ